MIEHGYPPHLTPEPWGPLKVWGRIRRAFAEWRAGFFETTESERTMKIHRWSPWLRRHWTWAPFTLSMISTAVEILWVPTVVIGLLLYGADDLKAWIASLT